jgi:hypothetical protein
MKEKRGERRKRPYTQRKPVAQTTTAAGHSRVRFLARSSFPFPTPGRRQQALRWWQSTTVMVEGRHRRFPGAPGLRARAGKLAAGEHAGGAAVEREQPSKPPGERRAAARATADGVAGQPRTHRCRSPL